MSAQQKTIVDIPIKCPIVTAQTVSTLIVVILDALLFERKQIPFVYPTFKFMVEKFRPLLLEQSSEAAWDEYLIERERRTALDTLQKIKSLKRDIVHQIEHADIGRVLILFGPNTLIASEAFEVELPPINRQHFGGNHQIEDSVVIRRLNTSLLTASNQFETKRNSHLMDKATNVFVLFQPRNGADTQIATGCHVVHNGYEPHPDCAYTTFRLRNTADVVVDEAMANCCRKLMVFRDMAALELVADDERSVENDAAKTDGDTHRESDGSDLTSLKWFESNEVVTGFKDAPIKGKSIWI